MSWGEPGGKEGRGGGSVSRAPGNVARWVPASDHAQVSVVVGPAPPGPGCPLKSVCLKLDLKLRVRCARGEGGRRGEHCQR